MRHNVSKSRYPIRGWRKNIIVGIGNMLCQDEGVGVWLARYLKNRLPTFDVLEAGNLNFSLLHKLRNRRLIIFVDALSLESEKEYVFFEVYPRMASLRLSFHESSIEEILHLAALAGVKWGRAFIFGIRACRFDFCIGLTESMRKKFGYFEQKLINHLAEIAG